MRTLLATLAALLLLAHPAAAVKVDDPTGRLTDREGNAGYVEVASEDGALLRVCNENEQTAAGDDGSGYAWVNPNGERTMPMYGTSVAGYGDADGEDGGPSWDGDEDTADDCAGNEDF